MAVHLRKVSGWVGAKCVDEEEVVVVVAAY